MAAIELQHLTKRYPDGTPAVNGIDLAIEHGELMIFVGPSGCGKTTVLRMIAGLEEISDGVVRIGERVVNDLPPKDRDIAMVFQSYALYPHMTVRENMGFALKLARTPKQEIARRVEEAARVLDLEPQLDRKPARLSGGQRQRVAMGRAIVREPEAFLMDEPLSNLDAKLRVEMRAAVSRLQRRLGTTTVYVTHDQVEAMTLGDRVAVMRGGVLQQVDAPRELYERPSNVFVAGFIGSPGMSFLRGSLDEEVVRTGIGEIPLHEEIRGRLAQHGGGARDVLVGVRPEAFEDARFASADADGWTFEAAIELTESMGSEVYVHFALGRGAEPTGAAAQELQELRSDAEADAPGSRAHAVARVDAASELRADERARLRLDTRRLYLFDAVDGTTLI